jgi:hypothetical protein
MENPKTITTPEIIRRAKEMFWMNSESWTGKRWDWDKAGDEVQGKFIQHAINGTTPWSKAMSEVGVGP